MTAQGDDVCSAVKVRRRTVVLWSSCQAAMVRSPRPSGGPCQRQRRRHVAPAREPCSATERYLMTGGVPRRGRCRGAVQVSVWLRPQHGPRRGGPPTPTGPNVLQPARLPARGLVVGGDEGPQSGGDGLSGRTYRQTQPPRPPPTTLAPRTASARCSMLYDLDRNHAASSS